MPTASTRNVIKYRVTLEELTVWTEWPTQEEIKAPRDSSSPEPPKEVRRQEWIESDQIATAKRASLAAYLRGLADELDPTDKTVYRGN
jgi:hypothetical protein